MQLGILGVDVKEGGVVTDYIAYAGDLPRGTALLDPVVARCRDEGEDRGVRLPWCH